MKLVWKLLRRHISILQFIGFFFANLFGMFVVLLGVQFYRDILPVFTAEDSFMKNDFLIVSKKIGSAGILSERSNTFSQEEINEIKAQVFVTNVGAFTGNEFKVHAQMGIHGTAVLNSDIFLESVPDDFIDISLDNWKFEKKGREVPIILPRSYITMYNFGFAQSHSLPKISDGLVGLIELKLNIHGNGHTDTFKGHVVGFSNRLNTILVPETFMEWANNYYVSREGHTEPSRLIFRVNNPTDERITKFIEQNRYELESDNLNAEKTTYFLRVVVTLVMFIGLVISVLSFYILMLSIYLLVQKNSSKLENLLLIGYSPSKVAFPYQALTIGLNILVLLMAWMILFFARNYYMDMVYMLYPQIEDQTMLPAFVVGIALFLLVTSVNLFAIWHKIINIWNKKE